MDLKEQKKANSYLNRLNYRFVCGLPRVFIWDQPRLKNELQAYLSSQSGYFSMLFFSEPQLANIFVCNYWVSQSMGVEVAQLWQRLLPFNRRVVALKDPLVDLQVEHSFVPVTDFIGVERSFQKHASADELISCFLELHTLEKSEAPVD